MTTLYHLVTKLLPSTICGLVLLLNIGCSEEAAVGTLDSNSDTSGLPLPRVLAGARNLDTRLITAFITIDNGSQQQMIISGGQATAEITGLSDGSHEFALEFEYASPKHGKRVLATAAKIFSVSANESINFSESDYHLPDDDGDGFANVTEINNSNWDPDDPNNPGIDDDNYEINDTQATAYDLSQQEGVPLKDQRGLAKHVDDDWYKVTLSGDRPRITIDLSAESSDHVRSELIDVGGKTLSMSASKRATRHHDYIVPRGGEYFIRISSFQTTNSQYDLVWTAGSAPNEDDYENNNDSTQAFNLKTHQSDLFGTEGLSTLNGVGIQNEEDWYRIQSKLNNLQKVEVNLNFDHSAGNIDFDIFDTSSNLQYSSRTDAQDKLPNANEERVVFYTRKAQELLVRVYGSDIGNIYELDWNTRSDSTEEDFYEFSQTNNTLATATDFLFLYISNTTNIISLANMWDTGIQNDDDWYEIEVSNNKRTVKLDLIPIETTNNLEMTLSDSSGTVLETASDNGAKKNINTTVSAGGNYYVRISGENVGDLYNVEMSFSAQ